MRHPWPDRPHQDVGIEAQTLRTAFNAAHGTVRIVMVVSPTCGSCLRGAADIQADVFDTIDSPDLRGFVVWVPKLNGHEDNIDQATHTISDPRVTHYWDGSGYLVQAYEPVLDLGQDAWDIYLLYGPDARWDTAVPPGPRSWMHQLSTVDHPTLDAATLAAQTRAAPDVTPRRGVHSRHLTPGRAHSHGVRPQAFHGANRAATARNPG